MSSHPTDIVGTPPVRVEPDAHGQAAFLLAESILHVLVEKDLLTTGEAVVHTACEVKVEVALAAGESKRPHDRVAQSAVADCEEL